VSIPIKRILWKYYAMYRAVVSVGLLNQGGHELGEYVAMVGQPGLVQINPVFATARNFMGMPICLVPA
jgi:hypothetical protein